MNESFKSVGAVYAVVVDIATIRAAIATTYSMWTRQATLQQVLKVIGSGIASLGTMQTAYAPTSITTKIHVSPKRRTYFDTALLLVMTNCFCFSQRFRPRKVSPNGPPTTE